MSATIAITVTIPETVKRIRINTDHWSVELFGDAPHNPYGDIWEGLDGDYEQVRLMIAASVCEIPMAQEWDWECYRRGDGWETFAEGDSDENPMGEGDTIAAAISTATEGVE